MTKRQLLQHFQTNPLLEFRKEQQIVSTIELNTYINDPSRKGQFVYIVLDGYEYYLAHHAYEIYLSKILSYRPYKTKLVSIFDNRNQKWS